MTLFPSRVLSALPAAACVFALCLSSRAQVAATPFFFPGGVAFQPEISAIDSGPLLAPRAVVSADRKYVTIGGTETDRALIGLEPFTFATLPTGFVGAAQLPNVRNATPTHRPTILDKPGMTFIAPLTP
jgi:hypothetical protein